MTQIRHSEKVLFMKTVLAVLILTFSLQSMIKAEDISDFEIEGISIGDSLLDFFSKNQIDNFLNYGDNFSISLTPLKHMNWINNEAY